GDNGEPNRIGHPRTGQRLWQKDQAIEGGGLIGLAQIQILTNMTTVREIPKVHDLLWGELALPQFPQEQLVVAELVGIDRVAILQRSFKTLACAQPGDELPLALQPFGQPFPDASLVQKDQPTVFLNRARCFRGKLSPFPGRNVKPVAYIGVFSGRTLRRDRGLSWLSWFDPKPLSLEGVRW